MTLNAQTWESYKDMDEEYRACLNCGRLFEPENPRILYCKMKCKNQASYAKKKARATACPDATGDPRPLSEAETETEAQEEGERTCV